MFNYTIDGQVFRAERTFIDHCGKTLRTAKIINETVKPFIREKFGGEGTKNFGGKFTVTVFEATTNKTHDKGSLIELAKAKGATDEEIAACIKTSPRKGNVSFNKV
jgi:hypothetical protein